MVAPNRSRPSARDSAEIQRHESMNAAVAQSILVAFMQVRFPTTKIYRRHSIRRTRCLHLARLWP
jgi:hypothetical protein